MKSEKHCVQQDSKVSELFMKSEKHCVQQDFKVSELFMKSEKHCVQQDSKVSGKLWLRVFKMRPVARFVMPAA